jgi:hypothetical protein
LTQALMFVARPSDTAACAAAETATSTDAESRCLELSKNSQEGGKFGRKSYENLLSVFSPSCEFRQFFRGFTP